MKKISNITFYTFSLLLILTGCQQKEIGQPVEPSNFLKASIERRVETKSQLGLAENGKYYAFWTEGDDLAVYVDGLSRADRYVLSKGAGTEKGVFAGTLSGDHYIALYPYSDNVSGGLKDNVLTLELPAEQTYAPDSFGEGAFPMLAVSVGDELPFKNLCAALKVSMTGEALVKSISFVAHDEGMAVSGRATVRTDFSDVPELVMSADGSPRVTLKCGGVHLADDSPVDFYIVVPAGTYKGGFSLEVETFTGTFTRTVNSDVTFERSQCRYIKPFRCDAQGVIDPDDIPYNQIWYSTVYNVPIHPFEDAFDRKIVSNTYENGRGVILFDGNITRVGKEGWTVFNGNVSEVILPNSVESIESYAFRDCSMTEFHTPDNLKSIGERAFSGCYRLARIYGSLASDDEKALVLPDGTMAVYAMASLDKDLVIPEGVKTIVEEMFINHSNIETVTFLESVVSLGERAFAYCDMLREFKGKNVHVPDGHAFINPDGEMVALAGKGLVDYVIPDEVKFFPPWSFYNNKTLHSVTFPKLKFSNYYYTDYFEGCDKLEFFYGEDVTEDNHGFIINGRYLLAVTDVLPADYRMPEHAGVVDLGSGLFHGIANVERITIPDQVQYLREFIFSDMPDLKAVQLPSGLLDMGYDSFINTTSLDTLYFRSFSPPGYYEYNSKSYFGHDGLVICVPEGFEDRYKSSEYWSRYAQYIRGWHYDDLAAPDYYISSDFSRDGEVVQLQKAKKGRGIDIVLMGDAFSDRQVEDGTYASTMNKMMEAFFSEEPYTTYRDLFNVYAVTVVSDTEGYENPGHSLSCWFGDGTLVGGNDSKCFSYALNAVPDDRMDNTLIIVAMNSTKYAGTCYMYHYDAGDYGIGSSVAYFPVGSTDEGLARLVHHEAGGHGFAKLTDEYAYQENGSVPQNAKDDLSYRFQYGWWKNGDFTNDPNSVKWAHFLADERYKYDGLGCFEGAFTYWSGAWRPTQNSIMRDNTGGFNAPSREAIWYRLHKLAYGESWQYDYEEFVAYDAVNRKTEASAASPRRYAPERPFTPTAPPVVVEKSWREVLNGNR